MEPRTTTSPGRPGEHDNEATSELARNELELELLERASELLVGSLDDEATLAAIVRLAVPSFADWAFIHLVEPDGSIRRVEVSHRNPKLANLAQRLVSPLHTTDLELSDHPAARAYRTGRAVLVESVDDDFLVRAAVSAYHLTTLRVLQPRSFIAVPLVARARVLGVMTWSVTQESGRVYTQDDKVLAEAVGTRAALAVDNARIRAELGEADSPHAQTALLEVANQSAGAGAWDWNLRAERLSWSPQFADLIGVDRSVAPSYQTFISCVHPDDRTRVDTAARSALSDVRLDFRIIHTSRGVRWLATYGRVLHNTRGEAVRVAGIMLDVTEKKDFDERLTEMDRRKDEFIAMLGHELRNPVAALHLAVELLRADDHGSREHVQEILERQTRQLSRLLDDLLDVSRISRGKIEIRPETIDLRTVIQRSVENARLTSQRSGHTIEVSLPRQPMSVYADPLRMEQVMNNLLSNAVKFTPQGGRIKIRGRNIKSFVTVSITDTGIGLTEDMRHRAFELFAQDIDSLARTQGGLGVGLTIAKRLIELHGGAIEAHSDGVGKGATFITRLPRTNTFVEEAPSPPTNGRAANDDQPRPHARLKILVVDDNLDAAELLARVLSRRNYEVEEAYDGKSALEHARVFQPDVVLLDIGLPEMDGYEVARTLRQEIVPRACLVALTGYGQARDVERAREAGFAYHVLKPADMQTLQHILDQAEQLTRQPS